MFNSKSIALIRKKNIKSKIDNDKYEPPFTETPKSKLSLLDNTIFHHTIHQSLIYKNHLFNINPSYFNLDILSSIINKHNLQNNELSVCRYNKTKYKHYTPTPPSNAIQISFSKLPNITFYIFNISNNHSFQQYLMNNIRYDLDLKILQNILKLSLYYHNISNIKIASIIRYYLLSEYHPLLTNNKNKILTHNALLYDIIHCKDEDILNLIQKCKQKINMILSGTVGLFKSSNGFEWIAMAINKQNNTNWMEMTVNIFPDRQWMDNNNKINKYQFHMFITRNFQFCIHQWINRESTTPKLSLWLHTAAKMALNAQHIVSRPIGRMKLIMTTAGFLEIEHGEINQIINEIGTRNYESFNEVQGVNNWLISPQKFNLF